MIRRFQIEDLIFQDSSGVTFRALDTETGEPVALRRFFPFGPEGGGLQSDEQTAYNIALERLSGIHHPSLRAVVTGGCDPVDGIPYIATEWVEGEPLHFLMADGPLPPESAAKLVMQALEVCELLSHVLAEESIWIDTDLPSIVVGAARSGREFTFWISPLKWLGGNGEYRGLNSIVSLTEEVLGWQGRAVNDQAGLGLGIWLKWLRTAAATTTLKEARESLAASIGVEPPAPVKTVVATATRPVTRTARVVKPIRKRKSKAPVFTGLILLCVVAGGVGWWWVNRDTSQLDAEVADIHLPGTHPAPQDEPAAAKSDKPPATAVVPSETSPNAPKASEPAKSPEPRVSEAARLDEVNRRMAELSANSAEASEQSEKRLETQKAGFEQRGAYLPGDVAALLANDNKQVTVEGILESFDGSGKNGEGNWLYLVFSNNPVNARGKIVKSTASAGLAKDELASLVGKKIRITGVVSTQRMNKDCRPLIEIKSRASITEAP